MRTRTKLLLLAVATLILTLLAAPGCGGDDEAPPFEAGGPTSVQDQTAGICLLNNCLEDVDCGGCNGGKTVCSTREKRCVACGPNANGKQCAAGQTCTKYGDCVGAGLSCPEDEKGVPTKSCNNDADCGACGPAHKVCDGGKCVGCSAGNTSNCQSTDVCTDNKCAAKCPATCDADSQCGRCGTSGTTGGATACNNHKCAECSPTKACPGGEKCDFDHGTCKKKCGLNNRGKEAKCKADKDCAGCTGTTKCDIPLGGGEGTCVVPVPGCSDLAGPGIFVLPDPFSRVTNLCSNDQDCANVAAEINVGKILREFTGANAIGDGSFSYGMKACADVDIFGKSCGVCVPCKVDTDCRDIDPVEVAGDIFGPIGSIASKLLLDKAFGPGDRKINMYCENVAGGYGVCLPCSNPLQGCKVTGVPVPQGTCNHSVCQTGDALGASCADTCAVSVCQKDPYCCTTAWDSLCKNAVETQCGNRTCFEDECKFKEEGWYCFGDGSAFRCTDIQTTAEGRQCSTGTFCNREDDAGGKAQAKLCTSANEPGCGPAYVGKPRCFPTKNY